LVKNNKKITGQRGERAGSRDLQEISGGQVGQATEEVQTTKKSGAAGTSALGQ
jgi:hypothetical protein